MTPQLSFQIINLIALFFWILLIFFYSKRIYRIFIYSGLAFILLGLIYLILMISHFSFDLAAFSSLENIENLYSNPWMILTGWVHYLAFDLLAGVWIRNDSLLNGINQKMILIPLVFTFLTGPLGLLIYLTIKYLNVKNLQVS
ncbi:MAG: ABA4-like family protein [Bacteroidota bacterium]